MAHKKALILGINGQDGSYLADLLLAKGYEVHGLVRRSSSDNLWRIRHIGDKITLWKGDLLDQTSIETVLRGAYPTEVYNLADQDNISWGESIPGASIDVTAGAVSRILSTIRRTRPETRYFQPVTAYILEEGTGVQTEESRLDPRSTYACAKACAYHLCRYYRLEHAMHVSVGIMYNHDSPRRRGEYLLQSICKNALDVKYGKIDNFSVGSLDAQVDIGAAQDYVGAMHAMVTADSPGDYIVASGCTASVRNIVHHALDCTGVSHVLENIVTEDASLLRNGVSVQLQGDTTKIREQLDWSPTTPLTVLINQIISAMRIRYRSGGYHGNS